MGIFSRFRKNSDDEARGAGDELPPGADAASSDDDTAPGWDAITAHFEAAYPDQTNPVHFGTLIKYSLGGDDPIDGISVYRAAEPVPHWHYVTYGYSDLYGIAPADDPDAESGYGVEMTFRLADDAALAASAQPPMWVASMLQNLARYVFQSGNVISAGHHINANGPIALDTDTRLTALAFTEDPVGAEIRTPSGAVRFVQGVGITEQELGHCVQWNAEGVLDTIGQRWPRGITVLDRPGLDTDPELVAHVQQGVERDGSSLGSYNVETLHVTREGGELRVALSSFAAGPLAQAVGHRLPYGRPLHVFGAEEVLALLPETDDVVRDLDAEERSAVISLSEAGAAALADLPGEPGEYRLDAVPGVLWRLVAAG